MLVQDQPERVPTSTFRAAGSLASAPAASAAARSALPVVVRDAEAWHVVHADRTSIGCVNVAGVTFGWTGRVVR